MAGITSGGGGGYDYVESSFPDGAEEGDSLYHITNDAAYVYTGAQWVEQTVTDHGQLSGVSEGDHRSDQRVSDLAPVQSRYTDGEAEAAAPVQTVNGRAGAVSGLFEASDYNPEADTHSRYTDDEASNAAPVQSVNGQTGTVSVSTAVTAEFYDKSNDGSGTDWYDASGAFVLLGANNYGNGSRLIVENRAGEQSGIGINTTSVPDGWEVVRIGLDNAGSHIDAQWYEIKSA